MVKLAEVVDPVGFAFELPDMMPSPQSASKPAAKAASVKKPAVKASTATVTVPKPADKKAQVEEDVISKPKMRPQRPVRLLLMFKLQRLRRPLKFLTRSKPFRPRRS